MGIDTLTAGVGIFSFLVFLLVHAITFRAVAPERLLKSLFTCVIALLALPVGLMIIFFTVKIVDTTLQGWVCATAVALVMQGLLCFVYVLCIFGPFETSVRMRLIREIAAASDNGISMKEILQNYNHETIANLRLQRLIGSGDITEKAGRYRVTSSRNLFFVFDAIAGVIKKWIGR